MTISASGSTVGAPYGKLALLASPTPKAQDAAQALAASRDWVPLEEADAVIVLGAMASCCKCSTRCSTSTG
jgi:NAD+ kinase